MYMMRLFPFVHMISDIQSIEFKHIETETKWPPFCRQHFWMYLLEWKCMNFDYNLTEVRTFLGVELTIFQHWFRKWLGANQVTTHYLNQWWHSLLAHICVTRPHWVMMTSSNGNIFRVTGHLWVKFTGPRWIPRSRASDAGLRCFLWSASE